MDVTVSTVFEAPRALVATIAGDPLLTSRWMSNVHHARWHGDPHLVEGATFDLIGRLLGREMVYTYRVLGLVPGERLAIRTEHGAFPLATTMTWWDEEPEEGGQKLGGPRTGMSMRRAGRPHGMTTLGSGAVTLGMKRAMRRDLERLRLLLREEIAVGGREVDTA